MRRLIAAALVAATLLIAGPAEATIIRPDHWRHPTWEWGKCRHHDAPWGAGRDTCQISRYGSR